MTVIDHLTGTRYIVHIIVHSKDNAYHTILYTVYVQCSISIDTMQYNTHTVASNTYSHTTGTTGVTMVTTGTTTHSAYNSVTLVTCR